MFIIFILSAFNKLFKIIRTKMDKKKILITYIFSVIHIQFSEGS